MRWLFLVLLAGCRSESKPAPIAESTPPVKAAPKPPDEMDEKMRHCPLALDGATSSLEEINGGVRFTIKVPDESLDEVRRRAHHIVEFAAKKTRAGHGEFDGNGGGRMKNCPVVTDDVTITATDVAGGAQVDVIATPDHVDQLRAESRERAQKFPFAGATVTIAAKH